MNSKFLGWIAGIGTFVIICGVLGANGYVGESYYSEGYSTRLYDVNGGDMPTLGTTIVNLLIFGSAIWVGRAVHFKFKK